MIDESGNGSKRVYAKAQNVQKVGKETQLDSVEAAEPNRRQRRATVSSRAPPRFAGNALLVPPPCGGLSWVDWDSLLHHSP